MDDFERKRRLDELRRRKNMEQATPAPSVDDQDGDEDEVISQETKERLLRAKAQATTVWNKAVEVSGKAKEQGQQRYRKAQEALEQRRQAKGSQEAPKSTQDHKKQFPVELKFNGGKVGIVACGLLIVCGLGWGGWLLVNREQPKKVEAPKTTVTVSAPKKINDSLQEPNKIEVAPQEPQIIEVVEPTPVVPEQVAQEPIPEPPVVKKEVERVEDRKEDQTKKKAPEAQKKSTRSKEVQKEDWQDKANDDIDKWGEGI